MFQCHHDWIHLDCTRYGRNVTLAILVESIYSLGSDVICIFERSSPELRLLRLVDLLSLLWSTAHRSSHQEWFVIGCESSEPCVVAESIDFHLSARPSCQHPIDNVSNRSWFHGSSVLLGGRRCTRMWGNQGVTFKTGQVVNNDCR